jgi:hypothetical protein
MSPPEAMYGRAGIAASGCSRPLGPLLRAPFAASLVSIEFVLTNHVKHHPQADGIGNKEARAAMYTVIRVKLNERAVVFRSGLPYRALGPGRTSFGASV